MGTSIVLVLTALAAFIGSDDGREWSATAPELVFRTEVGSNTPLYPAIASDPRGFVYATAWIYDPATKTRDIYVRTRHPSRGWLTPVRVSHDFVGGFLFSQPPILADDRVLVVGWIGAGPSAKIAWSTDHGRTFSAPVIATGNAKGLNLDVALGPDHSVHVVYRVIDGQVDIYYTRSLSADGGVGGGASFPDAPLQFEPVQNLTRSKTIEDLASVGVDRAGDVYVGYLRGAQDGDCLQSHLLVAERGGAFRNIDLGCQTGPPQCVADPHSRGVVLVRGQSTVGMGGYTSTVVQHWVGPTTHVPIVLDQEALIQSPAAAKCFGVDGKGTIALALFAANNGQVKKWITLLVSHDDGITWSEPLNIDIPDPWGRVEYIWPSLALGPEGTLHALMLGRYLPLGGEKDVLYVAARHD